MYLRCLEWCLSHKKCLWVLSVVNDYDGLNVGPHPRCAPPQESVNMLSHMAKGTLQRWLRVLRWGEGILDYPGGLMWCDDHKDPYKGQAGGSDFREGTMMMEADVREMLRESLTQAACRNWKRQGTDSLPEPLEGTHPCWPILDFWPPEL